MEMPLPHLEEQRRIVARIEELAVKIDEACSLRQQAAAEADALIFAAILLVIFPSIATFLPALIK